MRKVEVVPHQSQWRHDFEIESTSIANILGKNVVAIYHIGSTAIPNIYAKPIIDILIAVQNMLVVDQPNLALPKLGYVAMGEFGIPDRRFFYKNSSTGIRTHHVHIFVIDSPQIKRHLAFRDHLIAHPATAQAYSDLKRELARQYPQDIDKYMEGKDGFIQEIDHSALEKSDR
jgi:GrpB-like predicted nucleotidyltransferase (UPF0157 family)